jgi:DNA-binding NarL/FixJ family response regulator
MDTPQNQISILIADDHPLLRKGLRMTIEADPGLKVVAEADDGLAALAEIERLRPQVAVVDVNMPRMGGFDLLRALSQQGPKAPPVAVVFLTMYSDEELFNEALDLGARGYVLKESAVNDIVSAIKTVAAGRHYLSAGISSYLVSRNTRATAFAQQRPSLNDLTPAERRILRLIAANKSSKQIADELGISHRTVENHRTNICQKLEIHGINALLKFALEHKSELL